MPATQVNIPSLVSSVSGALLCPTVICSWSSDKVPLPASIVKISRNIVQVNLPPTPQWTASTWGIWVGSLGAIGSFLIVFFLAAARIIPARRRRIFEMDNAILKWSYTEFRSEEGRWRLAHMKEERQNYARWLPAYLWWTILHASRSTPAFENRSSQTGGDDIAGQDRVTLNNVFPEEASSFQLRRRTTLRRTSSPRRVRVEPSWRDEQNPPVTLQCLSDLLAQSGVVAIPPPGRTPLATAPYSRSLPLIEDQTTAGTNTMAEKEATVYVVDLSKSMNKKHGGRDQSDLEWALLYVCDKITTTINTGRKTATLGIIGLGTDDTVLDNAQLEGDESYEHMSILYPISQMLLPDLRNLLEQLVPSSTDRGDAVSAVVLAVDMIEKHCRHLKWTKKIILVTDGKGQIDPDLGDIPNKIKMDDIEVSVLGVDFDDAEYGFKEDDKPEHKAENEKLLRKFTEDCGGNFGTMKEAIDWLPVPRIKAVRPVTTYKGRLELGDPDNEETLLSIDIERYPKTMIARPPAASSFVLRQDGSSQAEGMEVVRNLREYTVEHKDHPTANVDGKIDVSREELARGFQYGKTAVAISESDENITKMETEQGYQIIGFVPVDNVERYMILENSNQIVAQRTNPKAMMALSSLVRALAENETCAVARVVRKDMTDPLLTLLSPLVEPDGFECLIENFLPFAEDLRSYRFPPIDKVLTVSGRSLTSHRNLPSDELQTAVDKFVDTMDLTNIGGDEYVRMDETFSPVLHRIEGAKKWRAVHPDGSIPPVPDVLLKHSKPPPDLIDQWILQSLIKAADVKKVSPKVKGRKRFREAEKPLSGLNIEELFRKEKRGQKIDPANAIPSFKQMLDLAEDESVIPEAMKQMTALVEDQIKNSFGDSKYHQVVEGLSTMRTAMVEMEEPKQYNKMLLSLKKELLAGELGGDRKEMWYLIRSKRVGLIDNTLSPMSDVTPEQADEFMRKAS